MKQAELDAIKAVWAKATPATAEQWGLDATIRFPDGSRWILGDAEYHPGNMALARTYAAAPTHIAALLDEVERLQSRQANHMTLVDASLIATERDSLRGEVERLRGAIVAWTEAADTDFAYHQGSGTELREEREEALRSIADETNKEKSH